MTSGWRRSWVLDPIVVGMALLSVALGSVVGVRVNEEDVDERLFRSTLVHMQEGDSYYDASAQAIREKDGVGPSQVRSLRTPVVAEVLARFPSGAWRWLAAIPALALCLAAAALAGPDLLTRRLAVGLTGLWLIVCLPLLYLHQELWGAALLVAGAVQMRDRRDGRAALLCLAAAAVRELFGISLLVGLVMGRDRRPWLTALGVAAAGAALHAHWAGAVLDPDGFDPPLRAFDSYLSYLSPGHGALSEVVGALLLIAAGIGFWMRRHQYEHQFALAVVAPLIVATALSGRSYWSLTWCGVTSAAGAVAIHRLVALRTEKRRSSATSLGGT